MPETTTLERLLLDDLDVVGDRAADERFCTQLYRALANRVWRTPDRDPAGRLSPTWQRAEWLVNEFRARAGRPPLTLAQTGGEGEVARTVEDELGRFGWRSQPLDTARDESAHLGVEASPPAADQGERMAPVDPPEDEQAAHEAASAEARRKVQ
jgi:hypothetical protein